ncbi:glycosyltransferase WbuB [Pseudidiomarina aestuarii]|uniref:Glycosyltransferase WbuB n=1 Tax=Pseudidiomarina aestuarii TaxID=624146 RepID=A0A7Z6ZUU5_9GAMM|nr:glycosyltransferase family 4 protein [Pseudidiomarina aestuarii]RUO41611.1 glycosyltransferase WbuB [Pseudidiomarina aestuarii]
MNKPEVWFINHYASTPSCGFGGRTYYFAKELSKRGYQVKLIICNPHHLLRDAIPQNSSIEERLIDDVNVVFLKGIQYQSAHSLFRIINWFVFSVRLRLLHKRYRDTPPNFIFCSSPSLISFEGAYYLSKKFKSRLIFDVRDIWPMTLIELGGKSPKNPLIRVMSLIERRAYLKSDYITSNLKNFDLHLGELQIDKSKFRWIPNGFDRSELYKDISSSERESGHKNFVVGYTGTFGLANAIDLMLEAALLLKNHKDIMFKLVGEGRELPAMQSFCKLHNLTNVEFLDFVPKNKIHETLRDFDVLMVGAMKSSLYKYGVSPNKLFDYFAAGKPIIYYIDSPNFNPIKDADCGIEVSSSDCEELSEAILQIKNMPIDERTKMGLRGREYANKNFDYSILTDKVEALIYD